jgi:hypothetical protein
MPVICLLTQKMFFAVDITKYGKSFGYGAYLIGEFICVKYSDSY